MSRPKKYKTKKAFAAAVDGYFRAISCTVTVKRLDGTEVLNDDGEKICVTEYVVPPSISALCLRLGIDRSTWQNYGDRKLNPDLAPVVERARAKIEAYLEQELLTRKKGIQGVIFNLQNNYGWKQKQEVELGDKTRKELSTSAMSLDEKMQLIRQAAEEYASGGEGT